MQQKYQLTCLCTTSARGSTINSADVDSKG